MRMPRPSNTEERRMQIARGLLKVMAARGYDGASIADVARTAQLTPGLVHYHFKDKREILLVALADLAARHEERLADALARAADDPREQVRAFIEFHLGLGADADPEAVACWILLSGEALKEPRVAEGYEQAIASMTAHLTEVIARGIERSAFTCEDARAAAAALVATIHGYFVLAATARSVIPPGSAAVSARRMAAGLLGAGA
jgi:TetR/AcrR family transcriptional repressor of bet genes